MAGNYLEEVFSRNLEPVIRRILRCLGIADLLRLCQSSQVIMVNIRRRPGYRFPYFVEYLLAFCVPTRAYAVFDVLVFPLCNFLTVHVPPTDMNPILTFLSSDLLIDDYVGVMYDDVMEMSIDSYLRRDGGFSSDRLRDVDIRTLGLPPNCVSLPCRSLASMFPCAGAPSSITDLKFVQRCNGSKECHDDVLNTLCGIKRRYLFGHDCVDKFGRCIRRFLRSHERREIPFVELYLLVHYVTCHLHWDLHAGSMSSIYLFSFLEETNFVDLLFDHLFPRVL